MLAGQFLTVGSKTSSRACEVKRVLIINLSMLTILVSEARQDPLYNHFLAAAGFGAAGFAGILDAAAVFVAAPSLSFFAAWCCCVIPACFARLARRKLPTCTME